jgi:hypothetical protein
MLDEDGQRGDARAVLDLILARFPAQVETPDLLAARAFRALQN